MLVNDLQYSLQIQHLANFFDQLALTLSTKIALKCATLLK